MPVPPPVQDRNLVGTVYGVQAVSDDDGRTSLQQPVDCALNQLVGCRVQARRCFVQDHQPGIGQENARKSQQLGLAGR
jgi:hypothetical protein